LSGRASTSEQGARDGFVVEDRDFCVDPPIVFAENFQAESSGRRKACAYGGRSIDEDAASATGKEERLPGYSPASGKS